MLEKIFGTSPIPTIIGYVAGGLLDARVIIESGGLPTTFGGWSTLLIGVLIAAMGRSAKQVNVTNAPAPLHDAKPVQDIVQP
jgi:hypothetical protein